jgi:hypothetical protein
MVSVSLNHFRPLSSTTVSQSRRLSNKNLRSHKNFSVETGGKLRKVWFSAGLGPTDGVGKTDSREAVALALGSRGFAGTWIRVVNQDGILGSGEISASGAVLLGLSARPFFVSHAAD